MGDLHRSGRPAILQGPKPQNAAEILKLKIWVWGLGFRAEGLGFRAQRP